MWVYEFTCTKCREVFVRSLGLRQRIGRGYAMRSRWAADAR